MFIAKVFLICYLLSQIYAVPPEACFANFRWDDCGKDPVRVMYYWKLGSRCEIGLWRGCLPNPNMFENEYECSQTCIFNARAQPSDYHKLVEHELDTVPTEEENSTMTESGSDATTGDSNSTMPITVEPTGVTSDVHPTTLPDSTATNNADDKNTTSHVTGGTATNAEASTAAAAATT